MQLLILYCKRKYISP